MNYFQEYEKIKDVRKKLPNGSIWVHPKQISSLSLRYIVIYIYLSEERGRMVYYRTISTITGTRSSRYKTDVGTFTRILRRIE